MKGPIRTKLVTGRAESFIKLSMGWLTSLLLAVALLVGTPIAIAGEQGVTLFDVELKATPDAEASTVGKVPKNTQVEIIERRGAWSRVRALSKSQGEGWVSTYDVRVGGEAAQREQSGETGLGRFLGMLFGEPTQHGPQVTSTIGIRGMDAADLAAAKPDPEEVSKLDQYRSNVQRAARVAASANLQPQHLDYLEASDRLSNEP